MFVLIFCLFTQFHVKQIHVVSNEWKNNYCNIQTFLSTFVDQQVDQLFLHLTDNVLVFKPKQNKLLCINAINSWSAYYSYM